MAAAVARCSLSHLQVIGEEHNDDAPAQQLSLAPHVLRVERKGSGGA